jgi:hypothetical protein
MFRVLLSVYWISAVFFMNAASAQTSTEQTWSDAWSWSNALTVMANFDAVYDAHASALIQAGDELGTGTAGKGIVDRLAKLPGVRGVVLSRLNESGVESGGLGVESKSFDEFIFKQSQATAKYKSDDAQESRWPNTLHPEKYRVRHSRFDGLLR